MGNYTGHGQCTTGHGQCTTGHGCCTTGHGQCSTGHGYTAHGYTGHGLTTSSNTTTRRGYFIKVIHEADHYYSLVHDSYHGYRKKCPACKIVGLAISVLSELNSFGGGGGGGGGEESKSEQVTLSFYACSLDRGGWT